MSKPQRQHIISRMHKETVYPAYNFACWIVRHRPRYRVYSRALLGLAMPLHTYATTHAVPGPINRSPCPTPNTSSVPKMLTTATDHATLICLRLHQLHCGKKPRARKTMHDDTLNVDILITRRTPKFQEDIPAGPVCSVSVSSWLTDSSMD